MKTDEIFYELFKLEPRSLFQLVGLSLEGEYAFESITVKSREKRFDGFFKRTDGAGPIIFLEVQGYADPKIYWRLFREICMYYEQTDCVVPFLGILLFLDAKYDPGTCPFACLLPHQFIAADLIDCLRKLGEKTGILTVLKPLTISRKEEVFDQIEQWKAELETLPLPEEKMNVLRELLEYLILQRFPTMDRKELTAMLQLTPLEKTVAGQEVFQMGVRKGMKEGMKKGELIGKILLAQQILKHSRSTEKTLLRKSEEELKTMFAQLEAALNGGEK